MPLVFGGSGSALVTIRKTTQKQVTNSTAETDLLNGEITLAAGQIGATGHLQLTAYGDCINNTGSAQASPQMKLKLGATTIFDTGAVAGGWNTNAGTFGWGIVADIQNTATNAQVCRINGVLAPLGNTAVGPGFVTGEGIVDCSQQNHLVRIEGYNSAAVDTTASAALVLSIILPTQNNACTYTLKNALVVIY